MDTTNTPRVLGLAGKAGSGKSLAADALLEQGWQRVKFAEPLKRMLRSLLDYAGYSPVEIDQQIEGALKEEPIAALQGNTPRHAMQTLGGEWGRDLLHSDLWIMLWRNAVRRELLMGNNVIVDDVRYSNEADALRSLGGRVLLIERPAPTVVVPDHVSERFEFTPDLKITNCSTREHLVELVRAYADAA